MTEIIESLKTKSVPFLVHSEPVFNVGVLLTETNFDVWSQLMEMHIAEREKLSYIMEGAAQPSVTDKGYDKWYSENQKVKRWLLMSMSPDLMKRYLRIPSAHEIWLTLSKAFANGNDEMQMYSLHQKAFSTKQGVKPISAYYGELTELFRELDHHDKVVMKDPEDVTAYRQSIERTRVHIFLAGLGDKFDQLRREILRHEPLLSLEECYSLVRREAVQSISFNEDNGKYEASAMFSSQQPNQWSHDHPKSTNLKISNKSDKLYKCTYCNQTGHPKSRCFEFIGYPDWWDPKRHRNSTRPSTTTNAKRNEDMDNVVSSTMIVTAYPDSS